MSKEKQFDNLSRIYVNESITPFVETNGYFIPLDMNIHRTPLEWLVAGLKTSSDNLGILHRNIIGYDFFSIHEVLEEYYKKLYDITDDVIEIIISMGGSELSMYDACRICPSLKIQKFTSMEAIGIVGTIFQMLINGFENCNGVVPSDVYSKFEEYIYWMRKEMNYKIQHFMNKK